MIPRDRTDLALALERGSFLNFSRNLLARNSAMMSSKFRPPSVRS
jgi:hypothetical protein